MLFLFVTGYISFNLYRTRYDDDNIDQTITFKNDSLKTLKYKIYDGSMNSTEVSIQIIGEPILSNDGNDNILKYTMSDGGKYKVKTNLTIKILKIDG